MQALRVEGLSKQFGGLYAVNNVSFSINVGERLAIIGPNGAGKTTLFNLINGQLMPSSGRIFFFGKDITDLPTHRRAHLGQARAFQLISLLLNLSIFENTLLSLYGTTPYRFRMFAPVEGFTDVRHRANAVLKGLGLWEKRDELVKNLGYGDQRRLEIGLGLAQRPKLLLLDEPSAGLSMEECSEAIEIINNLGEGITAVIVDHDMDLVFGVAERIIVLHYGQVIADGQPQEIKTDPRVQEIYLGIEDSIDCVKAD
ncbi:MAG: ABC transporter ATP-binding protein [Pseudomonadota bacterium]